MSLIEDAKNLLADTPMATDRGGRGNCHYCCGGNYEGGYLDESRTLPEPIHEHDCPWLSMPKIVAALEAANGLLQVVDIGENVFSHNCIVSESVQEAMQALVAAMQGHTTIEQPD